VIWSFSNSRNKKNGLREGVSLRVNGSTIIGGKGGR